VAGRGVIWTGVPQERGKVYIFAQEGQSRAKLLDQEGVMDELAPYHAGANALIATGPDSGL
jgi:hypothetical protein